MKQLQIISWIHGSENQTFILLSITQSVQNIHYPKLASYYSVLCQYLTFLLQKSVRSSFFT